MIAGRLGPGRASLSVETRKSIHSGEQTRIFLDRWLPRIPLFKPSRISDSIPLNECVSSLIDRDTNCWKCDYIRQYFSHIEAGLIPSLPIRKTLAKDKWTWHFSPSGKLIVKHTYHFIQNSPNLSSSSSHASSSHSPNPVWSSIWKLRLPPKIHHFLWRACSNSLPSTENLLKRGIQAENQCPFCNLPNGSLDHLFFPRSFSSKVWTLLGLSDLIHHIHSPHVSIWISNIIMNGDTRVAEFAAVLLSSIWFSRNKTIFEDTKSDPFSIIHSSTKLLLNFQDARFSISSYSPSLSSPSLNRPPTTGFKFFFDGSISKTNTCAGCGIGVLDSNDNYVFVIALRFEGIQDGLLAEMIALRESLLLAQRLHLSPFSILGDCQIAIPINNEAVVPSIYNPILEDISELLHSIRIL